MEVGGTSTIVTEWIGPTPMDTGAPEPVVSKCGEDLFVAYLAFDPDFRGWEAPGMLEYLASHPGEPFGVLEFVGVEGHTLGPPNDERLDEHRFYGLGLTFYSFHRVRPGKNGLSLWIVTFHDETLEVWSRSAKFSPMLFARSAQDAIDEYRESA